jgi:energy-coupling factor transport system ATP-binding protein
MTPIIQIENYCWRYLQSQQFALKNINLEIEEGNFIGVIGPNGAGKTTLAYSLNGLIPEQTRGIKEGTVKVNGIEVEEYKEGELPKNVGLVFADPEAQFTAMTVEDELVFGMENLGLSIPEIKERLDFVVDLTGIGPLLFKPPYEISGGQKQRVAIAAVLAMMPRVIVMDEPTSMLDPISRAQVFNVLAKMKRENKNTIIVIEHSLENLVPLADKMLFLNEGGVALFEETQKFFEHMDILLEAQLYPPGVLQFFNGLKKSGHFTGNLPLTVEEGARALKTVFESHKVEMGEK